MRRKRDGAFTMLELIATIAIIFTLAGLLLAGATMARRAARIRNTEAAINVLMTGCENYQALYRSLPSINPQVSLLGQWQPFRDEYPPSGESWSSEAHNLVLVWMLSKPRNPQPFIKVQQQWFKKVGDLAGPNGRTLFRAEDAWEHYIWVRRTTSSFALRNKIEFISAGPDGDYGTEDDIARTMKQR